MEGPFNAVQGYLAKMEHVVAGLGSTVLKKHIAALQTVSPTVMPRLCVVSTHLKALQSAASSCAALSMACELYIVLR
jgi:hypothetical protein